MKALFAIFCMALLVPTAVEAKKRTHVIVQKPYPPYVSTQPVPSPILIATIIAPPLLVFYDFQRRANCLNPPDPLGLGGPGFDGKPTPPSNVMISCWERRYYAQGGKPPK